MNKKAQYNDCAFIYAACVTCLSVVFLAIAAFSTRDFAGSGFGATGAAIEPQRPLDALLVVRENLTDAGRMMLPNSQARPLPS